MQSIDHVVLTELARFDKRLIPDVSAGTAMKPAERGPFDARLLFDVGFHATGAVRRRAVVRHVRIVESFRVSQLRQFSGKGETT
jgi:hypothetical protein